MLGMLGMLVGVDGMGDGVPALGSLSKTTM
jgi:hypothetical protein